VVYLADRFDIDGLCYRGLCANAEARRTAVCPIVGTAIGLVTGYFEGFLDHFLMRCLGGPYLRLHLELAVYPGLLIMLAVLRFNAMGDAIRDILDPRMLNRVRGGRTT
jgi:ABC-type dipeptide/oligopeptide/nickel transport system permease subunit